MAREKASRKIVELTKDKVLEQMLAEERVDSDEFDTSLLYRMFRYLLPRKGLTGLAVLLATCEALVMTIPAYLIGLAIESATTPTEPPSSPRPSITRPHTSNPWSPPWSTAKSTASSSSSGSSSPPRGPRSG